MILMYTGNILGKANVLSCDQVKELVEIRSRLGITTGGIPPCAECATNLKDVVARNPELGGSPADAEETALPAQMPKSRAGSRTW